MLVSAKRERPSLMALALVLPTPSTSSRSSMVARMIFWRLPKRCTMRSMTASGRRGIFEGTQRARHGVEAVLVALEGLQGLVGAVEQPLDGFEGVLQIADVHGDHRHVLGHRDHRHRNGAGDALGGAMAGAGLRRRHVRV